MKMTVSQNELTRMTLRQLKVPFLSENEEAALDAFCGRV